MSVLASTSLAVSTLTPVQAFYALLSLLLTGAIAFGLFLRARGKPGAERPTEPDWRTFDSYVELARAAGECHWLTPDDFINGPFDRFIEICSASDEPPRARARMMEFGRGALYRYCANQGRQGGNSEEIWRRARQIAAERLRARDPGHGEYIVEVLDGVSDHNSRRQRDEQSRDVFLVPSFGE